ncbi:TLC ATP/ADP transporter-domain-containing protein [Scenedesmus sp. NREL 46B-D3]|nr:TLC ATP/ADP transporter-domain-containing protein [Scenedesmus sp. NREL 46B-D3]
MAALLQQSRHFVGLRARQQAAPKAPVLRAFSGQNRNLPGQVQPTGLVPLQKPVFQQQPEKPVLVEPVKAAGGDAPAEGKKILGYDAFTWQKIIPLGAMFFCILFNYTILRDTKDVLVVTAPGSGAEIIPFLKTWVNLPMAIGFTVLYAKLANVLSTEALFYTCIFPFIAFFGAFAFVFYPLRDVLHPTAFCENLLEQAGPRFAGPIAILRNWTYCLFYVMAELWGSVVVSVLFWGFANQITTIRAELPPDVDGWGLSLRGLMGMVKRESKKKKKAKMSVGESFTFLAGSRYIRDLATLVVAYGISINLVEVTWKSKIKAQFPNPNDYSAFMGDFSTATGAVTFTMMILSRYIFRYFGWGTAALITPTVLLITGIAFFSLVLFSDSVAPTLKALGLTPLMAAVLVGAAQNVFSKSSKYSLFDPCKEMAYIPLDDEVKVKGKAAIDVICNPLGKSGGALIQQFMIIGFGSLAASTPYLGVILLSIVLLWINAANSLAGQFAELQGKDESESMDAGSTQTFKYVLDAGSSKGKWVPVATGEIPAGQTRVMTQAEADTLNQ